MLISIEKSNDNRNDNIHKLLLLSMLSGPGGAVLKWIVGYCRRYFYNLICYVNAQNNSDTMEERLDEVYLCLRGSRIPFSKTSRRIQWSDGTGVGLFEVDQS